LQKGENKLPNYKVFQDFADALRTKIFGVDSNNNTRPIRTDSSGRLEVQSTISGPVEVSGVVGVSGSVAISGPVEVSGVVGVSGSVAISGPVEVSGVVGVSGSVAISGPVEVSGVVGVSGSVAVSGPVEVSGVVGVSGSVAISGPVEVSGVVGVSGSVAVSGPVEVSGVVGVSGSVAVSGPVEVSGVVGVSGSVAISGPVDVSGTVTVQNTSGSPLYVNLFSRNSVDSGPVLTHINGGTSGAFSGGIWDVLGYNSWTIAVKYSGDSGELMNVKLQLAAISGDDNFVDDGDYVNYSGRTWNFFAPNYHVRYARMYYQFSGTSDSGNLLLYFQGEY
jgi:hypothetical protein